MCEGKRQSDSRREEIYFPPVSFSFHCFISIVSFPEGMITASDGVQEGFVLCSLYNTPLMRYYW